MRKFWGLAVIMVLCSLWPGLAAADSGPLEVTVHAAVQPACYIILSKDNQISEIITNSQQQVTPEVYYGNISPAHRAHLTADIYTKYLLLTRRNHHQIGVVYRFSPHSINNSAAPTAPTLNLAFKRHHANFVQQLVNLKMVGSILHG